MFINPKGVNGIVILAVLIVAKHRAGAGFLKRHFDYHLQQDTKE
jgi:hypothetical protein